MALRLASLCLLAVTLIGCASSLDRSPSRLQTIAGDVVALAHEPRHANVELTGISVAEEYLIVGLRDEAPDFVGEVASRFGSAVGFVKRDIGLPVACFDRSLEGRRPAACP
jgi:hypothetical protein